MIPVPPKRIISKAPGSLPPPKKIVRIPARPAEILFERPRWRGGPAICLKENLPAYESEKAARSCYSEKFPRFNIKKLWVCDFCKKVHAIGEPPPPTGESSGKKRSRKRE